MLKLGFVMLLAMVMFQNTAQALLDSDPIYSGEAGFAMNFNYSQFIRLPTALNQQLGKSFTFECWLRVPLADTINNYNGEEGEWGGLGITALNRPIVSRFRTDLANPPNELNDFNFQINPAGELQLFLGGSGSNGASLGLYVRSRTVPLVDNRWYHVAFTIEYFSLAQNFPDRARIYLNWEDVTGPTVESPVPTNFWQQGLQRQPLLNDSIMIGHYQTNDDLWPAGQYFVGDIDEVRFWTGVRSVEQLTDPTLLNFNRTIRPDRAESWYQPTLVAHYSFDYDQSAVSVRDSSPNGYHGQMLNNPERTSYGPNRVRSPLFLSTFEYTDDFRPLVIELRSVDLGVPNGATSFEFQYDPTMLEGKFYRYDLNGPNFESRLINSIRYGAEIPANTAVTIPIDADGKARIVYQWNGVGYGFDSFETFFASYRAVSDNNRVSSDSYVGQWTPVYIIVQPCSLDACGICDGRNSSIDFCGICGGLNSTLDQCGVCGGDNSSCLGCDGRPNGPKYDFCGVCGGNNGTCIGCDGSGGGQLDACGVCNGDNSTCGGCDGKGGNFDFCGECAGDNSTCLCVTYHGYHLNEMEYLLLQWSYNHTRFTLDCLIDLIDKLQQQTYYPEGFDVAGVIAYLCEYYRLELEPYHGVLDEFLQDVLRSFAKESVLPDFEASSSTPGVNPYTRPNQAALEYYLSLQNWSK